MEKKIIITMNQIDGTIDYEHEGQPSIAEALGMFEFIKMIIARELYEEEE